MTCSCSTGRRIAPRTFDRATQTSCGFSVYGFYSSRLSRGSPPHLNLILEIIVLLNRAGVRHSTIAIYEPKLQRTQAKATLRAGVPEWVLWRRVGSRSDLRLDRSDVTNGRLCGWICPVFGSPELIDPAFRTLAQRYGFYRFDGPSGSSEYVALRIPTAHSSLFPGRSTLAVWLPSSPAYEITIR